MDKIDLSIIGDSVLLKVATIVNALIDHTSLPAAAPVPPEAPVADAPAGDAPAQ